MLTFNVVLDYRASYSETSCDFLLAFFFSIRPTQYQERYSTLSEKKGGMALKYFVGQRSNKKPSNKPAIKGSFVCITNISPISKCS